MKIKSVLLVLTLGLIGTTMAATGDAFEFDPERLEYGDVTQVIAYHLPHSQQHLSPCPARSIYDIRAALPKEYGKMTCDPLELEDLLLPIRFFSGPTIFNHDLVMSPSFIEKNPDQAGTVIEKALKLWSKMFDNERVATQTEASIADRKARLLDDAAIFLAAMYKNVPLLTSDKMEDVPDKTYIRKQMHHLIWLLFARDGFYYPMVAGYFFKEWENDPSFADKAKGSDAKDYFLGLLRRDTNYHGERLDNPGTCTTIKYDITSLTKVVVENAVQAYNALSSTGAGAGSA